VSAPGADDDELCQRRKKKEREKNKNANEREKNKNANAAPYVSAYGTLCLSIFDN